MDVQRTVTRRFEQRLRKEQAVSRHHEGVGAKRAYLLHFRRSFQACRLADFEASRSREALHRTGHPPQASTRGSIGLRQHQDDLVTRRHQGRQSPLSELGRTGED
jgi:hypothetical protein